MSSLLPRVVSLLLVMPASGFYVPGVQPITFEEGESVPLKVNALTSTRTQIPRDYYKLPFCRPDDGPEMASENLGEFLTGNKIQSSPYKIHMMKETHCAKVCQVTLDKLGAAKMRLHIKNRYNNNWIIDNLNSAAIGIGKDGEKRKRYSGGFPIGYLATGLDDEPEAAPKRKGILRRRHTLRDTGTAYIFNHVNIEIDYHPYEGGYRVVGFAVEPLSVKHKFQGNFEWDGESEEGLKKPLSTCAAGSHMSRGAITEGQVVLPDEKILFTYDVTWVPSEVEWSSRWDIYLNEDHLVPAQVHWYSITNSILVVLFLSVLVISVLVRKLRSDIAAYNALSALADEEKEEEEAEKGWKLVYADVFRPPQTMPMLFCVFMGTGTQLAITLLFAIVLSAVGFLSPARRGSLMLAFLVMYMLFGIVAGYVSSKLNKSLGGRRWQMCTIMTAILFPGIVFGTFVFFNIILFFLQSSGSAPFLDVIIVAAMWCCVSIPLVFVGAYFGYKSNAIEFPTATSKISRAIPAPDSFVMHPVVGMLFGGVVPFVAAYVELFFIMTSLWMDQFYYVFGFTLVVYIIMIVTCAEITVLLVYYQLCIENHRWWWFSFFSSGSIAFITFGYSIMWFKQLEASRMLMTYMLYFGYMFLICFGMLLVFGMVGSMTSLWFVRLIYGTIKVD